MFSVIIPTFNRGQLLLRALDSVQRQSLTDYEIIVVDDGSTDGTREQLEACKDRFQAVAHAGGIDEQAVGRIEPPAAADLRSLRNHRLHYLYQPNLGPGAARNLGMRRAQGDYVAFLDSDDIWFPWTLATFAQLIELHDSPAVLGAQLVEFQDENELSQVGDGEVRAEHFADYFASSLAGYYVGAGMAVIRRDVLLQVGGFTEDRANAEDHDLMFRLGTAAGFVMLSAPITLGWRRHSDSETGDVCSTARGVLRMWGKERAGEYPGEAIRRSERRRILTGHARPAALGCLQRGLQQDAWQIYLTTWLWHLYQLRWRFLLAFPLLSLRTAIRSSIRARVK